MIFWLFLGMTNHYHCFVFIHKAMATDELHYDSALQGSYIKFFSRRESQHCNVFVKSCCIIVSYLLSDMILLFKLCIFWFFQFLNSAGVSAVSFLAY